MNALVVGGTGLVGRHLVKALLDSDTFSFVTVVVRKKHFKKHPKLKEVLFNFNDNSLLEGLDAPDHLFCCIGTTIKKAGSQKEFKDVDFGIPLLFGNWAERNNVNSFSIVTSMGADRKSKIFYNRVKGEVENKVKKMSIPKINIFRPSLILGNRDESRPGEKLAQIIFKVINPLFFGPLKKYKAIEAKKIAMGMVYYLEEDMGGGTHIIESDMIHQKK
tara:strand:- start:1146 stop:1799 length:654 start_codon:yes stop_codon:yes gene_type:complete